MADPTMLAPPPPGEDALTNRFTQARAAAGQPQDGLAFLMKPAAADQSAPAATITAAPGPATAAAPAEAPPSPAAWMATRRSGSCSASSSPAR
jgi:hypothetical protein